MELLNKIYLKAPFWVKRIFANAEAVRRDRYRRFGNYKEILESISVSEMLSLPYNERTVKALSELSEYVNSKVPAYKGKMPKINTLSDFSSVPFLTKASMRDDIDSFISDESRKEEHFKGVTSGSTGSPLTYYNDRDASRYNSALYDRLYEYYGGNYKKKIRISGVKITEFDRKKPPFWYYIDKYKQLQMSAYHISDETAPYYIEAMKKSGAEFATGYATAYAFLADCMLRNGIEYKGLKAIVTDSEGVDSETQDKIEKAFSCPVYQTYGLGEIGICAIQCKERHYHILTDMCYAENDGEEIVITNLKAYKAPLIRYKTGDIGKISAEKCSCGLCGPYFESIEGRLDDYVITPSGRKVGRLSHITKAAVGLNESQIIQVSADEIVIKAVPGENFVPESMEKVLENARNFLGDMKITYEITDRIERNKNGKLKHVIRKI